MLSGAAALIRPCRRFRNTRVTTRTIFIAGATGYMGRSLAAALLERGHTVRALARPGSEDRLPKGCLLVRGDALDAAAYVDQAPPADTFVHLVGAAHPAPWKGRPTSGCASNVRKSWQDRA